jgi:hypothetical protein
MTVTVEQSGLFQRRGFVDFVERRNGTGAHDAKTARRSGMAEDFPGQVHPSHGRLKLSELQPDESWRRCADTPWGTANTETGSAERQEDILGDSVNFRPSTGDSWGHLAEAVARNVQMLHVFDSTSSLFNTAPSTNTNFSASGAGIA